VTEIFAHRGSCRLARENTVAAFLAARELGADGIELDVHFTADGEVVVHHDAELPGLGPIRRLSATELPEWLPTLTEALEACRPLRVNVEIKQAEGDSGPELDQSLAFAVARLLASRSEAPNVVVSSFSLLAVDTVLASKPSLATALLVGHGENPMHALETARRHGHRGLHPFFLSVDEALVGAAKAAEMAIRTWTVDEPARIASLAEMGVDAVITNDVTAARQALGRFDGPVDPSPPSKPVDPSPPRST